MYTPIRYGDRKSCMVGTGSEIPGNGKLYSGKLRIPTVVTVHEGFGPLSFQTSFVVSQIGQYAFMNSRIESIVIPDTIVKINQYAFANCYELKEMIISNICTVIGKGAFENCTGFTGLFHIPSTITRIYPYAFAGFGTNITFIWPPKLKQIDEYGFSRAGFVGRLVIKSNLTDIGKGAFAHCTGLVGGIKIPETVEYIHERAFEGCTGITSLDLSEYNLPYIPEFCFKNCNNIRGVIKIPSCVLEIWDGAFERCSKIRNVVFHDEISSIGARAFYKCNGITGELKLPAELTEIGESAFGCCMGLTGRLVIPQSVATIGEMCFRECSCLQSIEFPRGLTEIPDNCFTWCTELSGTLIIPESVERIGKSAFLYCNHLSGVLVLPPNLAYIGDYAFKGCSGLVGVLDIPVTTQTIGLEAFDSVNFHSIWFEGENDIEDCANSTFSEELPVFVTKNYKESIFCYHSVQVQVDAPIYSPPEEVNEEYSYNYYESDNEEDL